MKNDRMWAVEAVVALAVATIFAPTAAVADTATPATFGSAAILTNRACTTTAAGDCELAAERSFTRYAGGAGTAFSVSATNENNSGASGSAYSSFSNSVVPTLGVASFSGTDTRTGTSAMAYQTFTYSGSAAINLALAGLLHYTGSGNLTATGSNFVEAGGRSFFGANLTLLPTSMLASFGTTAQSLVTGPTTFTDCSSGAIASAFASSLGTGAGEHSIPLSLTTACGGGAITINPGQSFVVLATVQALSNKGGYLDASHTFSSIFDPEKTVFADSGKSVGAAFLASAIAPVPEPATWSMMLLGFGLAGLATRRVGRASARSLA